MRPQREAVVSGDGAGADLKHKFGESSWGTAGPTSVEPQADISYSVKSQDPHWLVLLLCLFYPCGNQGAGHTASPRQSWHRAVGVLRSEPFPGPPQEDPRTPPRLSRGRLPAQRPQAWFSQAALFGVGAGCGTAWAWLALLPRVREPASLSFLSHAERTETVLPHALRGAGT